MGATRIYILARDTERPSTEVFRVLSRLGLLAGSHMQSVNDDVKRQVLDVFKKEDAKKPKPVPVVKVAKAPRAPRPPRAPKAEKPGPAPEPIPEAREHVEPVAVAQPLQGAPPREAAEAPVAPAVEVAETPLPAQPSAVAEPERPAPPPDVIESEKHASPLAVSEARPVALAAAPPAAAVAGKVALPSSPAPTVAAVAAPVLPAPATAAVAPATTPAPKAPKGPPSSVAAAAEAARAATAHGIVKTQMPPQPPPRPGFRPGPRFPQRYGPRPTGARTRPQVAAVAPTASRPAPAEPPPIKGKIHLSEGVTVKELSEQLGVKSKEVMRKLMDRRVLATINQTLDSDVAKAIARDFGYEAEILSFEEHARREHQMSTQGTLDGARVEVTVADETRVMRPPVVTVMGHVDHGKTSLLDAVRLTRVTESESGGITQHIGAYHVDVGPKRIVFLDTPGHEAFTMMRARGAKATDIVVLVVAADDGVMPQTIEAIHHARAANVPIVVAVNKIDKPAAQPDRVKQQLTEHGLTAEDWGGDTVTVEVSAKQRKNLDLLLEMILLVAELQDLKANPDRAGAGVVLESKLHAQKGPVCTVLIQNGTLKLGDSFIAGTESGKVRAMHDDRGNRVEAATPSSAVEVLGFSGVPNPGDVFQVVDEAKARQIAILRQERMREQSLQKSSRLSLDHLHQQVAAGEVKELPIILKCDVQGSVEVLQESLQKLSTEKVKLKIIHSQAGAISVSDVLLASASNAIIYGFNVRPERKAAELAQKEGVELRLHTVIYDIANEIKAALSGLLEPIKKENYLGRAEIRETFRIPKVGNVAGVFVADGRITRTAEARLLRDNVVVWQGKLASLRRFKDDVAEVKNGLECGIGLANYNDFKVGDVIEAFVTEMVTQTA